MNGGVIFAAIVAFIVLVAIVKTAVIVPLDKINDEDSIDYVEAVLKREASWM